MANTPNLGLPFIEAAQAQKHVTHNEALGLLDSFAQLAVESRTLTSPPGSPTDGACYIPAAGASGAWSGWDLKLAMYRDGAWMCLVPRAGMRAWAKAERVLITYEDGVWRDGSGLTAHGGRIAVRAKEEELTLSGAYVETADAAFIPARSIVLGVTSRVTLAITGATSFDVGTGADADLFASALGLSLDSTNVGVVAPAAVSADTPVRITANGASFTAGKLRLIAYFLDMSAPTG